MRVGEVLGLTWDRIDFKNMKINVNRQWKKLSSDKWGLGTVKRKNSNRTVPMSNIVKTELLKYKDGSFTDIYNRVIVHADTANYTRTAHKTFKANGYDITMHNLRHTYATLLIGNGVDFKTAAKLLGHNVQMTIKTYSHVDDDMMKKATTVVNNIF